MKKSELKKLIKPIVEECVRDVLFKQGVLSSVVSEVMIGMSSKQPLVEESLNEQKMVQTPVVNQRQAPSKKHEAAKNKLLDEIGRDAFRGIDIFEGTTPAPSPRGGGASGGALKDMDPNDPGVNIDGLMNIMGNTWKTLSKGK
jgi:hypothetical protein|tara:strand:- start:11429 stop:11857 length:429 start_codon:yes stop_codon:yes gene_type:complete